MPSLREPNQATSEDMNLLPLRDAFMAVGAEPDSLPENWSTD